MHRKVLFVACATILALAGCTSSNHDQNECAYGGCGDYNVDIDINGWDIFGPFLLAALFLIGIVLLIVYVIRLNAEAQTDADTDEDAEQP